MAYLPEDDEQDGSDGTAEQPQAPAPGNMLDGTSGAAGPAASGKGPAFAGITRYLEQNRPGVQRLAEKVGQNVQSRGEQARTALAQGQQQFDTAVGAGEVQNDSGIQNAILADPTSLANSPERLAQVQRLRDAQYGGPKVFEETEFYTPAAKALGDARRTGELADTAGGRMELIAQAANPGARLSKGRLALDEALLSADPTARGTLGTARSSLNDLDARLAQASEAARGRVSQAQATTDATREATRGSLTQARGAFETDLDKRLADARTEATRRATEGRAALQLAPVTTKDARGEAAIKKFKQSYVDRAANYKAPGQEILETLGLTPEEYSELVNPVETVRRAGVKAAMGTKNVDPYGYEKTYQNRLGDTNRFLTERNAEAEIGRGNLASAADYDRLAALNALSGEQDFFLNPAERGRAGTANLDLLDLDTEGLGKAQDYARNEVLKRAGEQIGINARSGSDSFLKEHGLSLATGGLVPTGGSLKDFGKALVNPLEAGKNLLAGKGNYLDPASLVHDNPRVLEQRAAEQKAKEEKVKAMLAKNKKAKK